MNPDAPVAEAWRYHGQEITSEQVAFLRDSFERIRIAAAGSCHGNYVKLWAGSRPTARCRTWFAVACLAGGYSFENRFTLTRRSG